VGRYGVCLDLPLTVPNKCIPQRCFLSGSDENVDENIRGLRVTRDFLDLRYEMNLLETLCGSLVL